ncbi:MAG: carboxypeptidase regulatory-like domain-containing protein [Janthinobacterium lividum]
MRKGSRKLWFGASVSAAMVAGMVPAFAQNVQGAVTGNVTDPSGAVIAGAHVVAHNVDTGVDSTTVSDAAGLYRINYLPIGRYTVTVHVNGFGDSTVPAFQLEALQTPTFNVRLTPGGGSETVTVSDAAPILNTSDSTLSGTFTATAIQNFPLNGLDFSALTLYIPGAVSTAGTSGTTSIERDESWSDSVNVNGNRAQANNYTLDGIDMNETFNNLIAYSPAPDALGEVKVLTANSPASYGNVNGGGVISVLKTGTNQFHGSLYGYLQDYHLNANSWNNNHASPRLPKNSYSQDQFGGTLGGPIIRNKLFFFVDYLGSRQHTGGTSQASVYTQAMRNGDFSALCKTIDATTGLCSSGIQLYDSENGFTPYLGDRNVPIVNPVAKFLFANPNLYPLPNATAQDGLTLNNLQGQSRNYHANNQGDIKIEYDLRNSDKITGFYSMSTAYDGTTSILPVSFPGVNLFPTRLGGANWVHIFSPTVVNSVHIGFTRVNWSQGLPQDGTGVFGNSGNAKVGISFANQAYQGFTFQSISGINTGVGNAALQNNTLTDNTFSYIDDITIQHGNHAVSVGVQALRYQNNYPTSNASGYLGQFNYTGAFTSNPAAALAPGWGGADFVLDRVDQATATLGSVNVGQRQWRSAGYINDDWKVLPNLTINVGLRYEYDQPWYETNNKTGNIDLATGQVIYAGSVPVGAPAGSGICSNRACYQPTYNQAMPRVGFSYQATGRFVVRGGYGATSFFEGNSSNQRLTSITPFIQAVNVTALTPTPASGNTPASGGTPRTAEEGFTGGTTQFGGTYNVYPQNIQPAYVQEYNLTTEYALSRTLSLQIGYVGEQGQHIEDYGNVNQFRVNDDPTSAPYYNNQYIGANIADTSASIGSNQLLITESRAAMNYSALQAVLRQRLSHGLEFAFNYTYGKALTNSLGNYGLNVNGYSGAFQNYYDSAADWGPAGYDVRHNVSANGTYELPVGYGKEFLANTNRIVDEVLGGWHIGAAGVSYSGFPQSLTAPNANANSFGNTRPNQYRALKVVNRTLDNWFGTDPSAVPCLTPGKSDGTCAFGTPAPNTFGTARNGDVRGPGFLNVDISAFKDFRTFREEVIGFRFDAFNAFNIASYGNPDTGITDTSFGNVSNQTVRSQERRFQFSAHYRF